MPESVVKQIKIMISSTRADLAQYREEASRIIKRVAAEKEKRIQLVELSMEKETQSGDREFAVAVSKRWVDESDWVVVIVGWNYGTISDEVGADGLSVTEWEYKHAVKLGKKLFVFIAGSPSTTNQYRYSAGDGEREDLKDWILIQTNEQKEKLEKFKQELGGRHADMFGGLKTFREHLEKTLKDAIDDLPPEIQPGTPLAELIVAVTPHIRDCIRKVTLIANCKRIHDLLHELRQHVIRPLREEVLSVWKQEGTLSVSRERVIWGCMSKASRQLAVIGEVRKSIGPEHQGLRDSVDTVLIVGNVSNDGEGGAISRDSIGRRCACLQRPELWNVESDSPGSRPSREEFTEVVDEFADDVQDAFSEADRSMTREESDLRERYLALLEGLKHARQQRNLSPSDHQRLDEELETIHANRSRLKNSLTHHHRWQEAHDKLHELDSFRETNQFEKKLNQYRGAWLAKLLDLVDKELGQADAHQAGSAETEQAAVAAVVQQGPPLLSPSSPHACNAFVDDLRHLKEWLEALRQGDGVVAFDKMRKPFDEAFYCVDKRTLKEVAGACERVVALEEWLDGLATGRRKAI